MEIQKKYVFAAMGYTAVVFVLGQYFQLVGTAIPLDQPFHMKIKIDGTEKVFENISLLEDPDKSTEGKYRLKIRAPSDDPFENNDIGLVIAQKAKISDSILLDILPIIKSAIASSFKWYGMEANYNYKESYVDSNTIKRRYSNGWILRYKTNKEGKSIRSSFIWVKK